MGCMLMSLVFLLLIGGTLVAALSYYRRGRNGVAMADAETGTLYVTGVSPHPNVPGEQYVTLSGSISGPSVVAYEAYGRFAWDTAQWPSQGDQIPVVYPAGKPDRWQIGHPGARPYLGSEPQRNPQAGQYPEQLPEQLPGQVAGQFPGQAPGKFAGQQPGQDPGQQPGQFPGQQPGQEPGRSPFQKPEQPGDQRS